MWNKVVKELRQTKTDYFIKIINEFKENSKLIWENRNKITKEGKSAKNWVIKEQSKLIEDTILNSVQCLAKNFGVRSRVFEHTNNEFPVFTIENVSESTVMKIFDCPKGSKFRDVFYIDAFFKNK